MTDLPWFVYAVLALALALVIGLLVVPKFRHARRVSSGPFRRSPSASALSDTQARQLLPGLVQGELLTACVDSLGTGVDRTRLAAALNDWWNVSTTEQAQSTLGWLLQEGHRAAWPHVLHILSTEPVANWAAAVYSLPGPVDRDQIQEYLDHLAETLPGLQEQGHVQSVDLARGIVAWDMGRAIIVARMCHDCKLITAPQAWEVIAYASAAVSRELSSWDEVARSTVIGRAMWAGAGTRLDELQAMTERCLSDPASPWVTTPFK